MRCQSLFSVGYPVLVLIVLQSVQPIFYPTGVASITSVKAHHLWLTVWGKLRKIDRWTNSERTTGSFKSPFTHSSGTDSGHIRGHPVQTNTLNKAHSHVIEKHEKVWWTDWATVLWLYSLSPSLEMFLGGNSWSRRCPARIIFNPMGYRTCQAGTPSVRE